MESSDGSKLTPEVKEYLTHLYTEPGTAGSFGGVEPLLRSIKEEGKYDISREQLEHFLSSRDEYTLHKPVIHRYPTHHIIVGSPNDLHQADLVDMGRNSAKYNDGVVFLLTVIDCFTRMAFVQPLKSKKGPDIILALEMIYRNRDTPTTFVTDSGKEFVGHVTQKWFKDHNVQFAPAHGMHKAQFIEHFNKTLKSYLSRYMTLHNSLRYIDVLQDIVYGYNTRYHSSTGYKPVDINARNAKEVFLKMYGSPKEWFKALPKAKYNIGDKVRITRAKGAFEKGYEETYTREIFTVDKVLETDPREYKLKSLTGEEIEGRFYEKEMVKVVMNEDDLFQIEKVLKKRTVTGVKQVYVKWKGWDKSHNQWIDAEGLVDI